MIKLLEKFFEKFRDGSRTKSIRNLLWDYYNYWIQEMMFSFEQYLNLDFILIYILLFGFTRSEVHSIFNVSNIRNKLERAVRLPLFHRRSISVYPSQHRCRLLTSETKPDDSSFSLLQVHHLQSKSIPMN